MLLQNVPLWHMDYSELKTTELKKKNTTERQQMQESSETNARFPFIRKFTFIKKISI